MSEHDWIKEFPAGIMVCDAEGILLEMNDRAARTYEQDGGYGLLGKNILECHPERAHPKLQELLTAHRKNVYTIEKNGIKKLIVQSPWFRDGKYAGIVELSIEIPFDMPHFVRTQLEET